MEEVNQAVESMETSAPEADTTTFHNEEVYGESAPEIKQEPGKPTSAQLQDIEPTEGEKKLAQNPVEGETPATDYQANFKYRVAGKDREIPEEFRSLVKDADSEKQIRDLFENAAGLEYLKPKFVQTRQNLEQLQQKWDTQAQPILGQIDQVNQALQSGSIKELVKAFRIPKEMILREAADLLRYDEMSPEERQRIDRDAELSQRAEADQTAIGEIRKQYMDQAVQLREMQLSNTLARADVSGVVQAFEEKYGEGSFRKEVIRQGRLAYHETRQDVPVEQIVSGLAKQHAWLAQGRTESPTPAAAAQVTKAQPKAQPKVIPNVEGRSGSPTAKVVKTMADLKALAKEKAVYQEE